jgi:hypothetical protein
VTLPTSTLPPCRRHPLKYPQNDHDTKTQVEGCGRCVHEAMGKLDSTLLAEDTAYHSIPAGSVRTLDRCSSKVWRSATGLPSKSLFEGPIYEKIARARAPNTSPFRSAFAQSINEEEQLASTMTSQDSWQWSIPLNWQPSFFKTGMAHKDSTQKSYGNVRLTLV